LQDNICFKGFVGGRDKFRLIKSSKVAVVPSYYESFGMVILEAFALGLPVIAYRLPVYNDIYTQGIRLVSIGDKNRFAEEVISLLENVQEREKLAKEARQLSEKFSWEQSANEILNYLRK
jgi:D-inositol-3-phosphate glycosyltransferase